MQNFVSEVKRRTYSEGVWEQGADSSASIIRIMKSRRIG
jgi:hypothetical protein